MGEGREERVALLEGDAEAESVVEPVPERLVEGEPEVVTDTEVVFEAVVVADTLAVVVPLLLEEGEPVMEGEVEGLREPCGERLAVTVLVVLRVPVVEGVGEREGRVLAEVEVVAVAARER